MLGVKLNHVSKRGPWSICTHIIARHQEINMRLMSRFYRRLQSDKSKVTWYIKGNMSPKENDQLHITYTFTLLVKDHICWPIGNTSNYFCWLSVSINFLDLITDQIHEYEKLKHTYEKEATAHIAKVRITFMIDFTVTSLWPWWRIKSPASRLVTQ